MSDILYQIGNIWTNDTKYSKWLLVEVTVCESFQKKVRFPKKRI